MTVMVVDAQYSYDAFGNRIEMVVAEGGTTTTTTRRSLPWARPWWGRP